MTGRVSRGFVALRIVGLFLVVGLSEVVARALGIYSAGGAIVGACAYIIITERPFS